jgi:hypothetical protein
MKKKLPTNPPSREQGENPNPRKKEKRDYFSDKEQIESGPDKNEGATQSQIGPTRLGMDYFEEGEKGRKSPPPHKRKKAA